MNEVWQQEALWRVESPPPQGTGRQHPPPTSRSTSGRLFWGLLCVNIASEWGGGRVGGRRWLPRLFGALPYKAVRLMAVDGEVRAELPSSPARCCHCCQSGCESQRKPKAQALGSSQESTEWGLLKGPRASRPLWEPSPALGRGCLSRVLFGGGAGALLCPPA